MMHIRIMRMRMHQDGVAVRMRMRLSGGITRPMRVLMVRIVHMTVLMLGRLMPVHMLVPLG